MVSTKHAAMLVAVVLAANACGGGDEPAEETPPPTPAAETEPDSAAQAAAAAAEARAAEEARHREVIAERINFDFDRSNIRADARSILDRKLEILRNNTVYRIRIEGHCDARGTETYNMALGTRRANAARQYLVDQGIAASRIETVSRGESQPLVRGTTRDAFAQNRRAEFAIIAGQGAGN